MKLKMSKYLQGSVNEAHRAEHGFQSNLNENESWHDWPSRKHQSTRSKSHVFQRLNCWRISGDSVLRYWGWKIETSSGTAARNCLSWALFTDGERVVDVLTVCIEGESDETVPWFFAKRWSISSSTGGLFRTVSGLRKKVQMIDESPRNTYILTIKVTVTDGSCSGLHVQGRPERVNCCFIRWSIAESSLPYCSKQFLPARVAMNHHMSSVLVLTGQTGLSQKTHCYYPQLSRNVSLRQDFDREDRMLDWRFGSAVATDEQ